VINLTFLAPPRPAKMNLSTSIGSPATHRAHRPARLRFAITEATIARSNALTLLGEPPLKPRQEARRHQTTL